MSGTGGNLVFYDEIEKKMPMPKSNFIMQKGIFRLVELKGCMEHSHSVVCDNYFFPFTVREEFAPHVFGLTYYTYNVQVMIKENGDVVLI